MSTRGLLEKVLEKGGVAHATPNDKLIRLMGIETDSVVENCFTGPKGPALAPTEFGIFWNRVEDMPREKASMVAATLKKLLTLKVEAPASEESTLPRASPITITSGTLMFLALFMPVPSTRTIDGLMSKLADDEAALCRRHPPIKEVMRVFRIACAQGDLVGAALIGASTMHSVPEFKAMENISEYPTVDPAATVHTGGCFWYQHLRASAMQSEPQRLSILSGLVSKMLTLPQQLKMNPTVAITTAHALFHMFEMVLRMAPLRPADDDGFRQRASAVLQQFHWWPLPFGRMAHRLLQLLAAEHRWPGAGMLQVLDTESRVAPLPGLSLEGSTARALYWVVDDKLEAAHVTMQVLRASPPTAAATRAAPGQEGGGSQEAGGGRLTASEKGQVLMNTFFCAACGLTPEEATTVSMKPGAVLAEASAQLAAIREECAQMGAAAENVVSTRNERLAELKSELLQKAEEVPLRRLVFPPLRPPYLCLLPPVQHVLLPTTCSYRVHDKETVKLMCLEYIPYPNTPAFEQLEYILNQHLPAPKPVEVRVMMGGGDAVVHAVLCAYFLLCQERSELLEGIEWKFCLVPFADNGLAQCVARHDSWYRRHVYAPFMSPAPMLPWLFTGEIKADADAGVSMPGRFLRETIETYAREAQCTADIQVFKVEGWLHADASGGKDKADPKAAKDKMASLPDQCIPFVQRVEIGIGANALFFKQNRKLTESVQQLIGGAREFAYVPPDLLVGFVPVDLRGGVGLQHTDDADKYRSVVITNVPQTGDKGFPANPLDLSLELSAQLSVQKGFYRNNVLATQPHQHVGIVQVTCDTPQSNFVLVADGGVFGPFHHITITPVFEPGLPKTPQKWPIQCFSPIDM